MAVICMQAPINARGPSTAPSMERMRGWVLHTYDCARRRARRANDQLPRLQRLVDARARRLAARAADHYAAVEGPLQVYRWRQVCRLCQLAPASVDWVARHARASDELLLNQFREHLDRRCAAIISELPHEDWRDD